MSLIKRVSLQQRLHHLRGMIKTEHINTILTEAKPSSGMLSIFYLGFFLGIILLAYHGYTLWVKKDGIKKKFIIDSRNVFSYEGTSGVPEEVENLLEAP